MPDNPHGLTELELRADIEAEEARAELIRQADAETEDEGMLD